MLAVIFFGGAGDVRGTWRHWRERLGWWVRVKSEAFVIGVRARGNAQSAKHAPISTLLCPSKYRSGASPFFDYLFLQSSTT